MKNFVDSCDVCVQTKTLYHHPHGFFQPLLVLTSPWFSISMDFITDLPLCSFYDSILVVVNHLWNGSFHSMYQNNNWRRNFQVSPWSCFSVSWSFWRYHFWLWALVCIQILKVIFKLLGAKVKLSSNFELHLTFASHNIYMLWMLSDKLQRLQELQLFVYMV